MKIVPHASVHQHSAGSILDGMSTNAEYVERAVELGLRGMGLTDHGNTTQVRDFVTRCNTAGITPVPGCEFYVAPINTEGAKVRRPVFYGPGGRKASQFDVSGNGAYLHLTVLATTTQGLKNLFRLSSLSYDLERNYAKPRIDFELLEENSEGLVVLTGCPSSEISTRFLLGQEEKAYEYAGRLLEVFGRERLFVEVMEHGMKSDLERVLLPKQVKLAKDLGLKLVATNDCHYAYEHDAPHHEEMLCTQSGSKMRDKTSDEGGRRFAFDGTQYYLKSGEQMLELFPEDLYPGAVTNSVLIAEMAQGITIPFDDKLRPKAPIPQGWSEVDYFKHLINKGFKERRAGDSAEVREESKRRIAQEFEVIHSSDFVGYFLTVIDYLTEARARYSTLDESGKVLALPVGVGRGSVGGSEIAYLTYISELDPIKHDLLFERFLSAGRGATYRVTYDDGSSEEHMVSDTLQVLQEGGAPRGRYIHQLSVGDEVVVAAPEEAESTEEADA